MFKVKRKTVKLLWISYIIFIKYWKLKTVRKILKGVNIYNILSMVGKNIRSFRYTNIYTKFQWPLLKRHQKEWWLDLVWIKILGCTKYENNPMLISHFMSVMVIFKTLTRLRKVPEGLVLSILSTWYLLDLAMYEIWKTIGLYSHFFKS